LKKHWCIIVDSFYPVSAGVGNSTYSLASAMVRHGLKVSVLTPRSSVNHLKIENVHGIDIYRIGGRTLEKFGVLVFLFYIYFLVCGLFLLLFRVRPDYVLGQTAWEGGILSGVWGKFSRKHISLVHTHGSVIYANKYLFLARIAYNLNKIILATNNEFSAQVKSLVPKAQPRIARNIFIPEKIPESKDVLRQNNGMNDALFHIIGVGRMVHERGLETKGFSYAIRAISTIRGVVLHLFGDGSNRSTLENLSEELHSDVRFHGIVSPKELASWMRSADCFLQSSLNEGVSMSMIEAMAYKLPVISTRTSGAIDIISDRKNGLLIAPGDDCAIHDAIVTLKEDPQLRDFIAEQGYQTYLHEFTETTVLQQYINAVEAWQ
jgi:glycosyltransferase involved in cell wall biosynthesis